MTTETSTPASETAQKKMKVAVAGLGAGAVAVVRAMAAAPFIQLVAAADLRPNALKTFQDRYGGRTYDSIEALCKDPEVEVVWISTPNQFHAEHTVIAANHGKHVVVEKPMALNLEQAQTMVDAADKNNIKLLCGHTASLIAGIRAMRKVITSGELGKIQAIHVMSYSDWMWRPRMAPEVDINFGGGVPYRQGPHQIDTIRLLGGGMIRSVRGTSGWWNNIRNSPGYYSAYMEFEDGTPATVVHNGYGYFHTNEFVPWAGAPRHLDETYARRRALKSGALADEDADKDAMRFGGTKEEEFYGQPGSENDMHRTGYQPDLGIVLASCENGDIRQSPEGLWIYDDNGKREVSIEGIRDERMAELDEMHEAIQQNRPVHHDGHWGMGTLEVILAMMDSGKQRKEIMLSHQCAAYE